MKEMAQEFKSIEEIKEEVACDEGFDSFRQMTYADAIYASTVDRVAKRFSQQYIEANSELVAIVKELLPLAEDGHKLHKSNGCHQDFLADDREVLKKAKGLVSKHKEQ